MRLGPVRRRLYGSHGAIVLANLCKFDHLRADQPGDVLLELGKG